MNLSTSSKTKVYWSLAAVAVAVVVYFIHLRRSRNSYHGLLVAPIGSPNGIVIVPHEGRREVDFALGHPEYSMQDVSTGIIVGEGDLATSPGFGAGAGTFGFGIAGSTFGA